MIGYGDKNAGFFLLEIYRRYLMYLSMRVHRRKMWKKRKEKGREKESVDNPYNLAIDLLKDKQTTLKQSPNISENSMNIQFIIVY